MNTQKQKNS